MRLQVPLRPARSSPATARHFVGGMIQASPEDRALCAQLSLLLGLVKPGLRSESRHLTGAEARRTLLFGPCLQG